MPAAGRLGDIGAGHGCFPPSPTIQGSGDVFTNFRPALRKGDAVLAHACGQCPSHPRSVSAGSATVNINSKPAARVDDGISCGGSVSSGSGDVIIGDDTYGSGAGEVTPTVRFVLSQVPGSTAHGYYEEPYKLFHNGSMVQEGLTDKDGVITFEPDDLKGNFTIEAVGRKFEIEVRSFAPADTDAGVRDRLEAFSFHVNDRPITTPGSSVPQQPNPDRANFATTRTLEKDDRDGEPMTQMLKALAP